MSRSKGTSTHRLPEPTALHPSDRWESLFVYSFILRFHPNLRAKIDGFESSMDLENALVSSDGDEILRQVLVTFITRLKPTTRNLRKDQITSTIQSILSDIFKTAEETVFWNDELQRNVDPFEKQGDIFSSSWDFKLKILRQLVELQLVHCPEIKGTIDRAWGVQHSKNKKKDDKTNIPPPPPEDPRSQQNLKFEPVGQDCSRKRYWIADDSPRVYSSSNPWKTGASFSAVSSTKEEYVQLLDKLKASSPEVPVETQNKKSTKRLTKVEAGHVKLVHDLEERLPVIENEIQRVARVRRKINQRAVLQAQAELRQTRTRRQTTKAKYVYDDFGEEEDEGDEYHYQEDEDAEDGFGSGSRRTSGATGTRRSARTANNGHNDFLEPEWRGERRSTRLGAPTDMQLDSDPPAKRAKTEESTSSMDIDGLGEAPDSGKAKIDGTTLRAPIRGAARLRDNEVAIDALAGKKKSRFWVYAVENSEGATENGTSTMDVDLHLTDDGIDVKSENGGGSRGMSINSENSA